MGNVSGRVEDGPALFLRDQSRLSIANLQVSNAHGRVLLNVTPNAFPSTRVVARKGEGEDGLVEFVQDPDPNSLTPLLLKLSNDDELHFKFMFNIRRKEDAAGTSPFDTTINGLTFVIAHNPRELENLVTREFHADPNIHKNPNVDLVGDVSTEGSSAVQFEWTWRWRPPQLTEEKPKNLGWRTTCGFVEYDQRAHRLSTLVQFSFWVQSSPRLFPPSPVIGGGDYPLNAPPKLRLASGETKPDGREYEVVEPPSPLVDSLEGSTLAASLTHVPSVKVDNCPKPVADNSMGEDGPLFRATMKSLEQKTGTVRTKMKKVIKRAEQARQAQLACNEASHAFMESLRDAASSGNSAGIQPALDHYYERTYAEILAFERQNEHHLKTLIIEPLTRVYQNDLKQAEAKKREFEEESRDYYNYVSRYLGIRNTEGKEKKKVDGEIKYQAKRKNFELKRFDYSTFMQDLHGGRKEQEILAQLTKFADAQAKSYLATAKKVQEFMPELDALNSEVKNSDKEFQMQRTDRENRRRLLEKSNQHYVEPESLPSFVPPTTPNPSTAPPSEILGHNTGFQRLGIGTSSLRAVSSGSEGGPDASVSPPAGLGLISHSAPAHSGAAGMNPKFRGIRDLQEKEFNGYEPRGGESDRRKEGLLWALSRPGSHADPKGLNKQAWHKYWVVLAGGQLCEYSNWKQKLDLHNDPINLKMATVREARSSERRFCLEVVTPVYARVYQAPSEEDMKSWISAISNAVKSTIESGGSIKSFDSSRMEDHDAGPAQLKNISSALTGKTPHYHHSVHGSNPSRDGSSAANNIYRRTTVGARPNNVRRTSNNFNEDPEKLLQLIRDTDPSNGSCADCGSQIKAEWVSINLGIVLCIECSGLHRSLGTHISKVRSLTLDVTSFTPDLIELLCSIGNRVSNSVWEARMEPSQRPAPGSSRETRLKFITTKYVDRAFVEPMSPTLSPWASPDEALLVAVRENEILGALYALALHASPNIVDPVTSEHILILALATADPTSSESELPASTQTVPPVTFPVAELLLQNGGEIPFPLVTHGLSQSAKNFLAHKNQRRMGTTTPNPLQSSPTSHGGSPSTKDKAQRERERLQKRVSSGARLHRAPVLER